MECQDGRIQEEYSCNTSTCLGAAQHTIDKIVKTAFIFLVLQFFHFFVPRTSGSILPAVDQDDCSKLLEAIQNLLARRKVTEVPSLSLLSPLKGSWQDRTAELIHET